jgi:putative transposase
VAKKRVGKFPKAFRQMAVDQLTQCDNIVELAKELGISRRLLYTWREKLEPVESGEGPPAISRESTLRHEVSRLKPVLAEKVLEVDFSKGGPCTTSRRDASGAAKLARRIYAHIRDVMSRQDPLSIGRMCHLAQISRAGFYRSLQAQQPVAEDMDVRSAIQGIAVAHRRRYGYRRITAEFRRRGLLVICQRLMSVPVVGPITAVAYATTVEAPTRPRRRQRSSSLIAD